MILMIMDFGKAVWGFYVPVRGLNSKSAAGSNSKMVRFSRNWCNMSQRERQELEFCTLGLYEKITTALQRKINIPASTRRPPPLLPPPGEGAKVGLSQGPPVLLTPPV